MSNRANNVLLLTIHYLGYTKDEIGLCSLAAYIRQYGYNLKLIGNSVEKINFDEILTFQPQVVGATIYERTKKDVFDTLLKIKNMIPTLKVCIGGPSVTFNAKELLQQYSFVDYAVKGEGEIPFLAILDGISINKRTISAKGVVYRDNYTIYEDNSYGEQVQNLDDLPFPSRDLLSENKEVHYAVVMGSRGCKGSCSFCYAISFWRRWRGRTVKNIVEEIEYLKNKFSVNVIAFEDNSLEDPDQDCGRLKKLAQELIDRKLNILFDCNMRAEVYKKIDQNILILLKKSGLCGIFLGIESGNDSDQKIYAKKATLADNYNSLTYFKKYNIPVYFGFINFNPYSDFEKLSSNIDFLEHNMAACSFRHIYSRYRLCRGTRMFNKICLDGLYKNCNDGKGEELNYSFVDCRIEKLVCFFERYFHDALLRNYFNGTILKDNNYETIQLLFRVWYHYVLSHIIRYFENRDMYEEMEIIIEYKKSAEKIFMELNTINADWFNELLIFAQYNTWNDRKAKEIINSYIPINYVNNICDKLLQMKYSVNLTIKNINDPDVIKLNNYIGYS